MGQQSNKVQKRRRRLDYHKRKKLATKTAATAKPAVAAKTSATPAKKTAEKPAAAAKTPSAPVEKTVAAAKPAPGTEKTGATAAAPAVPTAA